MDKIKQENENFTLQSVCGEGKFAGHPMICFKKSEEDTKVWSFGVAKAKIILDHIEEIKQFVEKFNEY